MKKIWKVIVLLVTLCSLSLCMIAGCGNKEKAAETESAETVETVEATDWQSQYDLGIRLLSEGNYKEAILAFQAAIEIEPKRANLYIALADAYVENGQIEMAQQLLADVPSDVDDAAAIQSKAEEVEKALFDAQMAAGLINEKGQPLNEYGAVAFEARDNYVPVEELSSEAAAVLEEIVNTVLTDNPENMVALAANYKSKPNTTGFEEFYHAKLTVLNDYKIELYINYEAENQYIDIRIEMRPENGVGYDIHIEDIYDSRTNSALIIYEWMSCQCVNWAYNGEMTQVTSTRVDSETRKYIDETLSGLLVDCIREGEWVEHYKEESSWIGGGVSNEEQYTYYMYEGGIEKSYRIVDVTEGTEFQNTSSGSGVYTYRGGFAADYDKNKLAEQLYW